MIIITLYVFLMILSAVANILQIFLGIPEITGMTRAMNQMVTLVIALKFSLVLIAFSVQQYETK